MLVLRRGGATMNMVAEQSHLGQTTVYRIMSGEVSNPRPAVRGCVERFVQEATDGHTQAEAGMDSDGS